ncbi:unnamed protein product [Darwinula stevensoni]|uniref:Uncharacterized protein n=1 Tax=Darwinula stevensoni TaxID=69355 RepID=A0A7R9FSP0_9CRUS|nr:unnamed protein product [Darwinula stevensoni]CAG0904176.1 unnamed protein product [Darwinula stevensoni]
MEKFPSIRFITVSLCTPFGVPTMPCLFRSERVRKFQVRIGSVDFDDFEVEWRNRRRESRTRRIPKKFVEREGGSTAARGPQYEDLGMRTSPGVEVAEGARDARASCALAVCALLLLAGLASFPRRVPPSAPRPVPGLVPERCWTGTVRTLCRDPVSHVGVNEQEARCARELTSSALSHPTRTPNALPPEDATAFLRCMGDGGEGTREANPGPNPRLRRRDPLFRHRMGGQPLVFVQNGWRERGSRAPPFAAPFAMELDIVIGIQPDVDATTPTPAPRPATSTDGRRDRSAFRRLFSIGGKRELHRRQRRRRDVSRLHPPSIKEETLSLLDAMIKRYDRELEKAEAKRLLSAFPDATRTSRSDRSDTARTSSSPKQSPKRKQTGSAIPFGSLQSRSAKRTRSTAMPLGVPRARPAKRTRSSIIPRGAPQSRPAKRKPGGGLIVPEDLAALESEGEAIEDSGLYAAARTAFKEQEVLRKARLRDLGLDSAIQPNEQDIAIVARVVERGESTGSIRSSESSQTDLKRGEEAKKEGSSGSMIAVAVALLLLLALVAGLVVYRRMLPGRAKTTKKDRAAVKSPQKEASSKMATKKSRKPETKSKGSKSQSKKKKSKDSKSKSKKKSRKSRKNGKSRKSGKSAKSGKSRKSGKSAKSGKSGKSAKSKKSGKSRGGKSKKRSKKSKSKADRSGKSERSRSKSKKKPRQSGGQAIFYSSSSSSVPVDSTYSDGYSRSDPPSESDGKRFRADVERFLRTPRTTRIPCQGRDTRGAEATRVREG